MTIYCTAIPKTVNPDKGLWGYRIQLADTRGATAYPPNREYEDRDEAFRELGKPECERCGEQLKDADKIGIPQADWYGEVTDEYLRQVTKYCWDCKRHIEKKNLVIDEL